MKTAIVTDSNSGIFEEEGVRLGIQVISMPVIIEGTTCYEGKDLSHEQFYRYLQEHKEISTSQPSPGAVMKLWESLLNSGYEEIVYIPMSSGLSSSCQTALLLAEDYDGRVQVVNNHRISVTQRHSVLDALTLRDKGYTAKEIREKLEQEAYESVIFIGVETLDFLKKGGRVTPAGAAMGTLLNIKPLLIIEGERLDAYAKVRGTVPCRRRLLAEMKKRADEFRKKGVEIRVGAAGSFADQKEEREWKNMVREAFPQDVVQYDPLTFSVSTHVGPGAFGMGISKVI